MRGWCEGGTSPDALRRSANARHWRCEGVADQAHHFCAQKTFTFCEFMLPALELYTRLRFRTHQRDEPAAGIAVRGRRIPRVLFRTCLPAGKERHVVLHDRAAAAHLLPDNSHDHDWRACFAMARGAIDPTSAPCDPFPARMHPKQHLASLRVRWRI